MLYECEICVKRRDWWDVGREMWSVGYGTWDVGFETET